jgi:glutathione S-transferase
VSRRLYELAGADPARRFSPYCWRIAMALAHKGLEYEGIPWRFTDKDAIAFSGQGLVPVLVDGGRTVVDSWQIALYLDEAYPDTPPLFGSEQARGASQVFKFWCEQNVHPALLRIIVLDLFANLHDKDQAYFRESREKRFGATLEQFGADRTGALVALRKALDTVRPVLVTQPYVGGAQPAFSDFILFGAFQWARVMSPARLLEPDDPMYAWRERMLGLYDGFAGRALGYQVWS